MRIQYIDAYIIYKHFIDLEKAFDRVPREVVWWALRKRGVDKWLINVIKSMYEGATTAVKFKEGERVEFKVKVGVHQGSLLSPLLFIIVMDTLPEESREDLPSEVLYTDDLVLIAASQDELMEKIKQ